MWIFINFGIILLFGLLLSTLYFVVEKFSTSNFILNKNIAFIIIEIIQTSFYGFFFFLIQWFTIRIYSNFKIPLFFIGLLSLATIKKTWIACFSIFPALIYFLLKFEITNITFLLIGGVFLLMLVLLINKAFLNDFMFKILSFSIFFIIVINLFFISIYIFQNTVQLAFEYILLTFGGFAFVAWLLNWIINISISANILYESINYDFRTFVRHSLKNNIIGNTIASDKITRGIYGVFDFEFKQQLSNEKNNEIKESILIDIESNFPKNTILFKTNKTKYGFFLPTLYLNKKAKNIYYKNFMQFLNKLLKNISKIYITLSKNQIMVNVYAGVSIYGIQEHSLNKLDENANFALKILNKKESNVNLFNPQIFRKRIRDIFDLKAFASIVNLDNYSNDLIPIIDVKNQTTKFIFLNQISHVEEQFIISIRQYIRNLGLIEIFDRYLAAEALQMFTKKTLKKVVFLYSPTIFEKEFYINEFIMQIQKSKLFVSNVILCIDIVDIQNIKNLSIVLKFINKLKEYGIQFALLNFEYNKIKQLKQFGFSYLIISYDKFQNLNKNNLKKVFDYNQIIIQNINHEKVLLKVVNKKIDLISGNLFKINSDKLLLDKKSKMYLEEILNKGGT